MRNLTACLLCAGGTTQTSGKDTAVGCAVMAVWGVLQDWHFQRRLTPSIHDPTCEGPKHACVSQETGCRQGDHAVHAIKYTVMVACEAKKH